LRRYQVASGYVMGSTTFSSYVGAIYCGNPGVRGSEGLMLRPAGLFGC